MPKLVKAHQDYLNKLEENILNTIDKLEKYRGNAFTIKTVAENTTVPYAAHYKVTGV